MDWSTADILLLGDVDEFRLEKNIKPEKSLDEIEKLYVDEKLTVFERACQLIGSSYDVQKIWAIGELVTLLKKEGTLVIDKLLPKVIDTLASNNVEIHKACSQTFSLVVIDGVVESSVFVTSFLPSILTHFDNKSQAISTLWLETLLAVIPLLPKDILKHKLLGIARTRGQLSQPVLSRQICCRIIGRMSMSLESYWVKQELLSIVKALAQDVDHDVRETMCRELGNIARSLGQDSSGTYILPEVVELSRDEEMSVRCIAMETIVDLLSSLNESSLQEKVVPLALSLLEEADRKEHGKEMSLRTKSSEVIGQLAHGLKGYLSPEQSSQILDLYIKLSQTPSLADTAKPSLSTQTEGQITTSSTSMTARESFSPHIADDEGAECRRLCAYNMPAMMLFADRLKETNKLVTIVKSLANDKNEKVRRTLACGFHEVISILGEKSHKLTKEYGMLLQDNSIEVLMSIVEHIPEVIEVLAMAHSLDSKTRQPGLSELIQPLLHFEQIASTCRQWRLHSNLLESLACLTRCMTSDQLYSKFVPLCWKCIGRNIPVMAGESKSTTYALPVKLAASRSLCYYIKSIRKADQRREICSQFIIDCARNDSHKQRLLFISICHIILDNFSRQFFKEQGFYSTLLNLAKDPSSNVRLKVCSLLPQLKTILLLPADREYQQMFESAISSLLMDRDSETIAAVNCAVKDMDKINYRIQSMITHSLLEEDIIDKEREEEEQQLLREEEYEREKESVISSKSGDFRRSAPASRTGGNQSPTSTRAMTSKKTTAGGGGSLKRPQASPSIARKTSNLACTNSPASPSTVRHGNKISSPVSAGSNKKRKGSYGTTPDTTKRTDHSSSDVGVVSTDGDETPTKGKSGSSGRQSASSSPSLSQASAGNTHSTLSVKSVPAAKSRDHITSTSKGSPNQVTKKVSSQYGLTYATKATGQRGSPLN